MMHLYTELSRVPQDLQTDINLFVQWVANNHFYCPAGIYKTKCDHIFMINHQPLERVQSYKSLGVN